MYKKLVAEFLGTFTLSFLVLLSLNNPFPIPTPFLAAMVVGLFVYTVGSISGAHLNPAVTLGLWSIKKFNLHDSIQYIVVQFFAAGIALFFAGALGVTSPQSPPYVPFHSMILELLGTAVLAFGIASVVYKNVSDGVSGAVIGGSLLLGVALSGLGGGAGILNPAVTASLGVFHPSYYITQILGGIAGFQLYTYLVSRGKPDKKERYTLAAVVLFLALTAFLAYSYGKTGAMPFGKRTEEISPTAAAKKYVLGTFKGTLPCADCSGLETELTLIRLNADAADGTYSLKETYVGKGAPIVTTGVWTTLRGTPTDENAVVYQLNPDQPEKAQYYLKDGDSEILMLDQEKNEIDGPFNYTLTLEE